MAQIETGPTREQTLREAYARGARTRSQALRAQINVGERAGVIPPIIARVLRETCEIEDMLANAVLGVDDSGR